MILGNKIINNKDIISERLKYLIEHDSVEHGGRITESHSTKLAKRLFENDYFKYDMYTEKTKSQQINAVSKTIRKHLNKESTPNTLWLKIYCDYFDCSADYLLGFIPVQKHDTSSVYNTTGLSHKSVEALKLIKSDVDNITIFHNNELETLNFILESIHSKQEKQNSGIGFTDSILHYIGLYLHNSSIKKEPATRIHYKYSDTKWDSLKNNSTIDGNTVQKVEILADNTNININKPDVIPVYDSANDQHYTLKFNELVEAYAREKIAEKLVELKQEKDGD